MINSFQHYIRIDENKNIIYGFSTAFEQPLEADICINEDGSRHFELFGVINISLTDEKGIRLYKYTDKVEKRTEDEIQADLDIINSKPKPKTELEILQETVDMLLLESLGGM